MFYKFISKNQIEKAPYPLHIGNEYVHTTDEAVYNEQGYYTLEREEYPQDGCNYKPYYELSENKIIQKWALDDTVTEA